MRRRQTDPCRRTGPADEGFALVLVLVLIALVSTFSLLVLSQTTQQARDTQFSRKHEQTLATAMAGLNVGLSSLRSAVNTTTGKGTASKLPCATGTSSGTLAGSVDAGGAARYAVTIYYLDSDPATMTLQQVIAAAKPCPQLTVPKHAFLVSAGSQAAYAGMPASRGNRTVNSVYDFAMTTATTLGGPIAYGTNCWDAGANPTVGGAVTFALCNSGPSQSWYYRPDLTVQWMGDSSTNLCLQRATTGPPSGGTWVVLATCLGTGVMGSAYDIVAGAYVPAAKISQEFPTQDSWAPATSAGGRDDSRCVTSYTTLTGAYSQGAAGDRLVTASKPDCVAATMGAARAASSSQVGAGAASGVADGKIGITQQIVNLRYGNRCLDVRDSDTSAARPLIHYICGQSPDYRLIPGNKRFGYVGVTATTGQLVTYANSPNKCFSSVSTYVSTLSCVAGTANQRWTLTGKINGNYAGSYTIVDHLGRCLTADPPNERFGTIGTTSLKTCTGQDDQKWNAPPNSSGSQVRGVGEQ